MSELRTISRHAGTVLVGQLAVMSFGVADTIIAGRYSPHALAVLSLASSIYISIYVALNGMLQALLPVWNCTAPTDPSTLAAPCVKPCTSPRVLPL